MSLLAVSLEAAVPLWIARLKADGGPTEETYERCRAWTDDLCGPGGEDLLFKSKKKGQSAARFNDLAYCLAVMAFIPGGVTFLGKHWEAFYPSQSIPVDTPPADEIEQPHFLATVSELTLEPSLANEPSINADKYQINAPLIAP